MAADGVKDIFDPVIGVRAGRQEQTAATSAGGVSAELWRRLKRLDRVSQCEIVLCRTGSKDGSCDKSRVWVVTIRRYIPPYRFDMVQQIRPTLVEALTLAVEESEARGWSG